MDNTSYCKPLADFPKPLELRFKSGLSRLPLELISGIGLCCIAVSKPRAVLLYGGRTTSAKKTADKNGYQTCLHNRCKLGLHNQGTSPKPLASSPEPSEAFCTSPLRAQCFLSINNIALQPTEQHHYLILQKPKAANVTLVCIRTE